MIVRNPKRKASRGAFTLTEMLVVIAIILTLAAIAVPITFSVLDSSRRDIAKSTIMGTLKPAVERYRNDTANNPEGALPESLEQLLAENNPKAGLTREAITDPWGHAYHFQAGGSHGQEYDIWSDGSGGKPIGNWKD